MTSPFLLKRLDAPVRFLSFSMNDLIIYLSPFFVGALFDSIFFVPAIGMGLVLLMKKLLKKFPRFYAIRYLYWSLPTGPFNCALGVKLAPSNRRIWIK
jgi:type IV conjugative transfer system protein TraL